VVFSRSEVMEWNTRNVFDEAILLFPGLFFIPFIPTEISSSITSSGPFFPACPLHSPRQTNMGLRNKFVLIDSKFFREFSHVCFRFSTKLLLGPPLSFRSFASSSSFFEQSRNPTLGLGLGPKDFRLGMDNRQLSSATLRRSAPLCIR
jgi:hypothetical protein